MYSETLVVEIEGHSTETVQGRGTRGAWLLLAGSAAV
jgi:hypothetical protein